MAMDYGLISDRSLTEILGSSRDDVELLEDILAGHPKSAPYPDARTQGDNYGRVLTDQELVPVIKDVCAEVDSFLGVTGIEEPDIGYCSKARNIRLHKGELLSYLAMVGVSAPTCYFAWNPSTTTQLLKMISVPCAFILLVGISGFDSFYRFFIKNKPLTSIYHPNHAIDIIKAQESQAVPAIGHEYDHHVLNTLLHLGDMEEEYQNEAWKIANEGHACGVQTHIAKYYANKLEQPFLALSMAECNQGELSAAYVWLCEKHGISVNANALMIRNPYFNFEMLNLDKYGKVSRYALGTAFFYLSESKLGTGIYADFVKGNFDFIKKAFSG